MDALYTFADSVAEAEKASEKFRDQHRILANMGARRDP